tara:strand:- start:1475 stop:1927 length:453 start_codon:yes stop_codon:yes gene_type:complete
VSPGGEGLAEFTAVAECPDLQEILGLFTVRWKSAPRSREQTANVFLSHISTFFYFVYDSFGLLVGRDMGWYASGFKSIFRRLQECSKRIRRLKAGDSCGLRASSVRVNMASLPGRQSHPTLSRRTLEPPHSSSKRSSRRYINKNVFDQNR